MHNILEATSLSKPVLALVKNTIDLANYAALADIRQFILYASILHFDNCYYYYYFFLNLHQNYKKINIQLQGIRIHHNIIADSQKEMHEKQKKDEASSQQILKHVTPKRRSKKRSQKSHLLFFKTS